MSTAPTCEKETEFIAIVNKVNESSDDSDVDEFHNENADHKPYRDTNKKVGRPENETVTRSTRSRRVLDDQEIKKRVRSTMTSRKKQERRHRLRKGESAAATKIRNDHRLTIKEGFDD